MTRLGFLFRRLHDIALANAIAIIVLASLAVKLGYILALGGGLATFPIEGSDVYTYDSAARIILQSGVGHELGGSYEMPPGESLFLAFLYAASDYSIPVAKLAHVALLTLTAVLTYLTGKELATATVGFWAGMLIAIDPAQAYLSGTFLSEPLFIFLMILGIYFLVRRQRQTRMMWLIGAGICFGLAGLTRNQGWLFAGALWLGAVVSLGRLVPIRAASIILVVTAATIMPWTLRNYLVMDHLILVSSEGGLTLWSSNNPEFIWRQPMPMSLPIYAAPSGLSKPELDQYYRQRAIDWLTSHPMEFAVNGIRKVIVLYSFDPLSTRPEMASFYRLAGVFPYGVIFPFILVGFLAFWRRFQFTVTLWYILFTTFLTVVFWGDSRVRAPIQPYLYIFGALGVEWFSKRLQMRRMIIVSHSGDLGNSE